MNPESERRPAGRDGRDDPRPAPASDIELRVRALEALLIAKGHVDPATLDELIETYETRIGPRNGARVVARAWTDPAYRVRLLADATAAVAELGYSGRQGEHLLAVENGPGIHHLVVCTLCSCYPWPVLGLPPTWYKSPAYRARAVIDPRGVLAEFGLDLDPATRIEVHDSTAELRYLVIPERPAGTGHLDVDALAALVTRDAMIGTAVVMAPAGPARPIPDQAADKAADQALDQDPGSLPVSS